MTESIDRRSGYSPSTKTYHSLRPRVTLPSPTQPLSLTSYVSHLSPATSLSLPFLISPNRNVTTYSAFFAKTKSLSLSLQSHYPTLSKNDVAFILSPTSSHVPVLYFALLSLGVTVCPANPVATEPEIGHMVSITRPVIGFVATSAVLEKLPQFPLGTVVMDSERFEAMTSYRPGVTICPAYPVATELELGYMVRLTRLVIGFAMSTVLEKLPEFPFGDRCDGFSTVRGDDVISAVKSLVTGTELLREVKVEQSDRAAILFSSGTTGRVKGVELTHRNLIALVAGFYYIRSEEENAPHPISLFFIPMYHVFGFFMLFRGAVLGETFVLMERFDFEKMLKAVETYKVTYMPVSPPLVVALVKSDLTDKYDLSSLRLLGSGGAPLGKEVSESFSAKFPGIEVIQGYGLTETGGSVSRMIEPHEKMKFGSVGLLSDSLEAKIVDPTTGEALPPNQRGELWLRGPTVMRGYVGDDDATRDTLDRDNWLKTGDLCYFDSDGFIYIVDRLKELIKYKAYQVPPAELEHLLQGHPEIADAAVVPYPDEEAGQIPMAFIVRKSGSKITAVQIMNFIANQVSPYKKIRRVAFINSIPKSPAGKILRRELVNRAVSGASSKL